MGKVRQKNRLQPRELHELLKLITVWGTLILPMRFLSVPFEITLDNEFKIPFTFLYILLLSTMSGKCDSVSISITFPLKASQWVVRLKRRFCLWLTALISSKTPQECSFSSTRSTWRTPMITCSLPRMAASLSRWPGSQAPSCRPPSKQACLATSASSYASSRTSPCHTRDSISPSLVGASLILFVIVCLKAWLSWCLL